MLQIQHGIAFLHISIILGRRIDHGLSPGLGRFRIILHTAHLAMIHVAMWTIIVALLSFRHFQSAGKPAITEKCFRAWVSHPHAVYVQEIVMKTNHERVCRHAPTAIGVSCHGIGLASHHGFHVRSLGRVNFYGGALLTIYHGILRRRHVPF